MTNELYLCGVGAPPRFLELAWAAELEVTRAYHARHVFTSIGEDGADAVTVLWTPADTDVAPVVKLDVRFEELVAAVEGRDQGFGISSLTALSDGSEPRFSAVLSPAERSEAGRIADSVPISEFRAAVERSASEGSVPRQICVWERDGEPWVTAAWGQPDEGEEVFVVDGVTPDQLDAVGQESSNRGAKLTSIGGYIAGGADQCLTVWSTARGHQGEFRTVRGDEDAVALVDQATRDNRPIVGIDRWNGEDGVSRWVITLGDAPGDADFENAPISGLLTPLIPILLFVGIAASFGNFLFLTKTIPDSSFHATDWFRMSDGVAVFSTDNPQIRTDIELANVTIKGTNGTVPQEVTATRHNWGISNGQLGMTTSQAGPKGAINIQDGEVQPTAASSWAAPERVPVSLERLALDYKDTTVDVWIRNPDYSQRRQTFMARLDSNVLMVPVEVAYFRIEGRKDDYRDRFRAVLDGHSTLGNAWTSTAEGQIRYAARQWQQTAPSQFWSEKTGLQSPDSIFRRARVCFRLRSYEVFDVERKLSAPRSDDFLEDGSAFRQNSNTFSMHTTKRAPALRVILMTDVAPPESLVEGSSTGGSAGVGVGTFESLVLAHEIAHVAGLGHVGDPKNLMNKTPSSTGFTAEQIEKLRTWAATFRAQW